jgi:transposase
MQLIHRCCCGLDVHKKLIVARLISLSEAGELQKEIRCFTTMTKDILALADWLANAGCTHVAMESTGVYWRPIWNLLEGQFDLLLVNAQYIKAVPGRQLLNATYANSLATAVRCWLSAHGWSTGFIKCWKIPISN